MLLVRVFVIYIVGCFLSEDVSIERVGGCHASRCDKVTVVLLGGRQKKTTVFQVCV